MKGREYILNEYHPASKNESASLRKAMQHSMYPPSQAEAEAQQYIIHYHCLQQIGVSCVEDLIELKTKIEKKIKESSK